MSNNTNSSSDGPGLLSRIIFRGVQPTDVSRCYAIESASYPEDEAASKSTLQYRQHHAAAFFRCAFLVGGDSGNPSSSSPGGRTSASSSVSYVGTSGRFPSVNPAETLCGTIIGFVCSTRCKSLTAEAMKSHDPSGKILAIHSVVVEERYRNCGVASAMLQDYVLAMDRLNKRGNLKVKLDTFVLMAKKNLLAFYVKNGFMATRLSPVVHGKEQWFELERKFAPIEDDSDAQSYECYLVDSFADVAIQGSGNPAGVVVLKGPPGGNLDGSDTEDSDGGDQMDESETDRSCRDRGVQWMATVAKEFNQSETAFIWPLPNHKTATSNGCLCPQQSNNNMQSPPYAIRYYTRTGVEVDLCGHATLAAAFCMLHPKKLDDPKQNHKIEFIAKNDKLLLAELLVPTANTKPNTNNNNAPITVSTTASRISLTFPWKNTTSVPQEGDGQDGVLNMMSRAFSGVAVGDVSSPQMFFTQHIVHIGATDGNEDLLIELTEEGFNSLGINVDYAAFAAYEGYTRGVIICCCCSSTAAETAEQTQSKQQTIHFRSRFFGPKVGIDEDPVTGSAHCALGPYFGNKLGKVVIVGRQESERGGVVECILKQDEGRVCIVGTAVRFLSGKLSMSIL